MWRSLTMDFSNEEIRILEILSNGRRKKWLKIAKELGLSNPALHLISIKNITKRLRKMNFVKRTGLSLQHYKITPLGQSVLNEDEN